MAKQVPDQRGERMTHSVKRPGIPFKLACLGDDSRYKVVHGGRGSGKSWGVARAC